MERILRSLFTVHSTPEESECLANWLRFVEFKIGFDTPEDKHIHGYLQGFYNQMSAPPEFDLIKNYFIKEDKAEVVARLDEISRSQCYIKTNFLSLVQSEQEAQQKRKFVTALKEAITITDGGLNLDKTKDGKKVLKGLNDAVSYLFDRASEFSSIEGGEKLEGVATDDAEELLEEYEIISKTNKFAGRNLFGLEPVDSVCRGHKAGEFWVHCAFAGELKTTLGINYAYNNAYVYGKNVFYSIHEMPYRQLRRMLFVLHSSHGKFITDWHEEDIRLGRPNPYMGLDYRKVRDGELDDLELKRFRAVAQDFKSTCRGKLYLWRPEDEVGVADIRRKAEMFHNKYRCDGIVIDYLGLVKPKMRTVDHIVGLNSVVRDARLLALNFARGKTVPILALFQLNRQGKLRADKADGRYDFAAISYANEIEKSADVITYTYLNDALRQEAKFYLGCLKNRDNPIFDRMVGKVLWQSKRMRAIETGMLDLSPDAVLKTSNDIILTADDMIM